MHQLIIIYYLDGLLENLKKKKKKTKIVSLYKKYERCSVANNSTK